ncbi:SRPBCC family protein [Microbacterium hydrocarbonoxydans]|uniref:SRPBCC family protein n=1 Tax=Microbacterium hydrocarbonoxydans TaxID=273678 RepID=UPI0013DB0E41|nr:SRPBCC family protein [Microbacterium hydrocarbonoxydans]
MIELASAIRTSTAPPSAFFERWLDHGTWPEWSPDTAWVRVDGPVVAGARGMLKPVGGPRTAFTVAECEPDAVYTDVSRLPGARLEFRHEVEAADAGSIVRVLVRLDGPLARFWARTAFRGFRTSVPADLDRLVSLVED